MRREGLAQTKKMTRQKQSHARISARLAALATLLSLTACANFSAQNAKTLVDMTSPSVGCESFESDFFDSLYKITATGHLPTEQQVQAAFASRSLKPEMNAELTHLYRLVALDGLKQLGPENAETTTTTDQQIAALAAMEIGDQTSPEKESLQIQIKDQIAKIKQLAVTQSSSCAKTNTPNADSTPLAEPKSGTLFAQWKSNRPRLVYGALKTLSTAYQSCEAAQVPALDHNTPDAIGISIVGVHPDGVGNKRLITNLGDLLKSHPYLKNYRRPASTCFDLTQNIPIYDYGGRPAASMGTLNIFKNAGTGTKALGTDCSGFIGLSIAASGLRVKKARTMKAETVAGLGSTMFTNPQKNGLTCFDYVRFNQAASLKPGDLIAKDGHIVIVESIGQDPFGLDAIKSPSDCVLANMSVSRFDFTILQDSPEKGGIGIQRSVAADYFPKEPVMPEGLLEAAVTACKAKFGVSGLAKNNKVAVVRHSGSSDCMGPGEIKMDYESCVASCPAL